MKTYEVIAYEVITSYDQIRIQVKANSKEEALQKAEEDEGTIINRDTLESDYEWEDKDKWKVLTVKK